MIKKPVPYLWLKKKILSIPDPDHRAFIALVYASFSRVGEIVRHHRDTPKKPIEEWKNPPLMGSQIKKQMTKGGNKIVTFQILTEKIREYRITVLYYDKEKWLANIILRYKEACKTKFLFNYSTRWANYIFEKYFGSSNIHVLRHWRITHWLRGDVLGYPAPQDVVARNSGHTSILTQARYYDHSVIEDYVDVLLDPKRRYVL